MSTDNNGSIDSKQKEMEQLVRKSDHLSLFGTLTSLVSTGFLFVEQAFGKKLSKLVNVTALVTTGVGIAAVVASFYYRFKAGNIAMHSSAHINDDQHIKDEIGVSPQTQSLSESRPSQKKWVSQAALRDQNITQELQR